jgi:hypothetical protein
MCIIQNDKKQGDASSPSVVNSPLEYAIRKAPENQEGIEIEWSILVSADGNLLGRNVNTINKNTISKLLVRRFFWT